MKRDINLMRQLLLDIENRGADCSVSVLRTGPDKQREERNRYHLRLLIDAGLLKEIDRTTDGIPCVRLTHQGHELLELTRDESIWQDALWTCQDRTDSLSLTVIQEILSSRATRRARQPLVRRHRPYPISGYRLEPSHRPYRGEQPTREEMRYRDERAYLEDLPYPTQMAHPETLYQHSIYHDGAPREYPEMHYAPVRETAPRPYAYDQSRRSIYREHADRSDMNGENRFRAADNGTAEPPCDSTMSDYIL
jgi:hypothetical protein